MVGLLLREVGAALQEFRDIRQIAIQVLKNLMIKHTFDDRYISKVRLSYIYIIYCVHVFGVWWVLYCLHFHWFVYTCVRSVYCVLQSQQARLATLYLPLFGLLQENVNRLNIKDTTPLTNSLSSSVRLTPTDCSL